MVTDGTADTKPAGVPLPFVSVCLLTYNRAPLLARSIESLLAQTHKDFELIINDDCSPDDTEEVCRAFEQRDTRVRYCRNERNLRYAGNQNAAVARAHSDYVAIVHDGDIYLPHLVETWTRALVTYPTAALVFNAITMLDQAGRLAKTFTHAYGPLVPGRELFREMLCRVDSPIFGIVMVRKRCVESVGPFDISLPTLADVDMWLRLLLRYDAAYICEPIVHVAPREEGHINRTVNWRIQDELERIHAMNLRRALAAMPTSDSKLSREVWAMLWRHRALLIAWCARHMQVRKLVDGLRFMRQKPVLSERSPFAQRWDRPSA